MSSAFGPQFERGLRMMLAAIAHAQESGFPDAAVIDMAAELNKLAALRGRPPFFDYLGSGLGRGARVRLADGRWVLDLTLGIGVHLFGHGNLDLMETAIRAAASDLVMQGNLIFNSEYVALMETLLTEAPEGIDRCWLSLSGADANENALKLLRQHRGEAPGVIAFSGCFHGRTCAMAEITDRPDYRAGQPRTFPVEYIPFYDRDNPSSGAKAAEALRGVIAREGDRIAAFMVELVQGEAGFRTAPKDFFIPLFEQCRSAGIPVWVDEVQTFGRVSELFATDLLEVAQYVDVITVGKLLQGSALLYRHELTPDPALISGTFSGATVAMAVGRRIIQKLVSENFFGPDGRERHFERLTQKHLEDMAQRHPGKVSQVDGVGAMIAFRVGDGSLDQTRAFIKRAFNQELVLYYGGHEPACVRLFLPVGVLTEAELSEAFEIIERCIS
jgi:4-aminobutyrate aminotransferase-like enzyme